MINSKRFAVFTVAALAGIASASAALNVPTQSCSYVFNKNTKLGSMDSEVMNLQKVLNAYPQTMISSTGAGSPGMETNYFGAKTKAAVIKFQELHKADVLTPIGATTGTGNVFSLTRAVLNQVCVGGSTTTSTTTPTTSGSVTVSLAAVQPTNVLVAGQATAKIADVVFSGNGTVNNVKFEKTGISNNATLKNVYLYDGMTRIAGPASVTTVTNAAGTMSVINFNSVSGLFTVAGTRTLSVRSDIDTGTSGQSVGVRLFSYTVAGSSEASLSLVGNNLPIASVSLLTADFPSGNTSSPAAASVNAGVSGQTVWSRNLSVGTRIGKLHALSLKMIGSAPANSLANVKLFVDGTQVSTAVVDASGYVNFDLSASPLSLTTGSHIVDVRADIVNGANRNFYMSLEQASDVRLEDSQVPGAFVTVTTNSGSSATNLLGGVVTINNGSLTIITDSSFSNSTKLVGGSSNTKVAAYKLTAYGEDVKVTSLTFTPSLTGMAPAATTLANVGLYVNGGQVNSNQTATHATALTFNNLGTNLVIPAGQTVVVELRGDIMSSSNVNYTGGTVAFNLAAGTNSAQGMTSSQTFTTSSASGQVLTIASTNVTFANTTGFGASTKAPNTNDVKIGSFSFKTGTAEGANITNIAVNLAGTMVPANRLTTLTVKDGSTVLGNAIGNPVNGVNNFSVNVNVPVNTSKTLDVYANIGDANGLTVTPSMDVTYRGATSNLAATTGSVSGPVTTSGVGTILAGGVTFVPGTNGVAKYLVASSSAVQPVGAFNIKSGNGIGSTVNKIVVSVPANTVGYVTLNGVEEQVIAGVATFSNAISIPSNNSGIDLPVSFRLVCANSLLTGCAGVTNSNVTATITSVEYNDGVTTNTIVPTLAVTATNKMVTSKPTVLANSGTAAFITGSAVELGTVTVTADANGDVRIASLPVTVSFPGTITLTNLRLSDDNGNTVLAGTSAVAAPTTGTVNNISFASPEGKIGAGQSKTYRIYANITGSLGTNESVTTYLGAASTFGWVDLAEGVTTLDGSLLNSSYTAGGRQLKN